MVSVDVCVIGAGPAGLTAAAALARYGRDVLVIDESAEPGGRLLGQLHRIGRRNDAWHEGGWWHGRRIAAGLAEDAAAAGVSFRLGCSVWGLFPGWQIGVSGEQPGIIDATEVLIATGASEIAVPLPGWTLPGVMTIGAGQVMATQHRVRPGESGIVVGINPLSLAIAHELSMAGTHVEAIVNLPPGPLAPAGTAPAEVIADLARAAHLAPSPLLQVAGRLGTQRWVAQLAAHALPGRGLRVWGIPVNPRRAAIAIEGSHAVSGVVVAELTPAGEIERTREVAVDSVFLAGGLRPLGELAALAGCQMIAAPDLGGTVPLHGPGLETTAPGVHIAGNIAGIESALVAMAQGRLAAAAIAAPDRVDDERRNLARARRESPIEFLPRLRQGRAAIAQAWRETSRSNSVPAVAPPRCRDRRMAADPFAQLPSDLVVCRCEGVTIGMVRGVAQDGVTSAEEIKRFTRMTMGACQGRVCQTMLERIHAAYNGAPAPVAAFPGHRPPLRPIALGDLASLADGREEWERLHGALLPSLPFDDAAQRRLGDPVQ